MDVVDIHKGYQALQDVIDSMEDYIDAGVDVSEASTVLSKFMEPQWASQVSQFVSSVDSMNVLVQRLKSFLKALHRETAAELRSDNTDLN